MERLRILAAYTVLGLWVAAVVLNMVDRSYAVEPYVHLAAGAVLTMLFGAPLVLRRNGGANGS